MTEPIRADQVPLEDERTEDEKVSAKRREVARSIIARREALRRAGADVGTSSPDLASDLESSLRRIDRKVGKSDETETREG